MSLQKITDKLVTVVAVAMCVFQYPAYKACLYCCLLLLFLVMLGSLIMGMGLPASACYAILCILAAPAIVKLGVPPLAAHLFVLYFGSMSAITPPVALAAFAAAPIAGESAVKIGFTAFKMAMPSFLIAFCLAIQPELVILLGTEKILWSPLKKKTE